MKKDNLEIEIKKILLTGLQKLDYPVTKAIDDILHSLLVLHNGKLQENMYIWANGEMSKIWSVAI